MASETAGSRQRTGLASIASACHGSGRSASLAATEPIRTTWLSTVMSPTCARKERATAPSATRATVSRALARSSTGRASSKPYFCMPARSAWPGRGLVSGCARALPASASHGTGSGLMTSDHLGHSLLAISMAIGPPMDCPCRTPPTMRTSSASNFCRAPRP